MGYYDDYFDPDDPQGKNRNNSMIPVIIIVIAFMAIFLAYQGVMWVGHHFHWF